MKNKYWIIIFLIIIVGFLVYFIFNNNFSQNNDSSNYTSEKMEVQVNNTSNEESNEESNNVPNNDFKESKDTNHNPTETEIATFTTKIMTKDSGRQNNISITCSTLNDTLVENGATFSFCNTVGQATTSKGYQKAEIFDNKRE